MNVTSPKISHATPQPECTAKPRKDFLKAGTSLVLSSGDLPFIRKDEKNRGGEKNNTIPAAMQTCLHDIMTLKKTPLRRRYRKEANTHRNMLSRRCKVGAVVHPAFWKFDSFLRHVGPIPAHKATLDRINNDDPEYAPGKVRWADKRTQNSNKGDSLAFYFSRTGDEYTSSRPTKLQGVTPTRSAHAITGAGQMMKSLQIAGTGPKSRPSRQRQPAYIPLLAPHGSTRTPGHRHICPPTRRNLPAFA